MKDIGMKIPNALSSRYQEKQNSGWTTFLAQPTRIDLRGFGTKRIGKLVAGEEFQFTIGAHGIGPAARLNDTIRTIISMEGLKVIEATSTNSGKAPYPAFMLTGISQKSIGRVMDRVEGAIVHIQNRRDA